MWGRAPVGDRHHAPVFSFMVMRNLSFRRTGGDWRRRPALRFGHAPRGPLALGGAAPVSDRSWRYAASPPRRAPIPPWRNRARVVRGGGVQPAAHWVPEPVPEAAATGGPEAVRLAPPSPPRRRRCFPPSLRRRSTPLPPKRGRGYRPQPSAVACLIRSALRPPCWRSCDSTHGPDTPFRRTPRSILAAQ